MAFDPAALVFVLGFLSFFLEIIAGRLFMFFLGNNGAFFAIPLAILGLALGSFNRHLRGENARPRFPALFFAFALSSTLLFILIFRFANFFLQTRNLQHMLAHSSLTGLLFVAPFFCIGHMLSDLYRNNSGHIGRLYFADFTGGALACGLAPVLFHYLDMQPVLCVFLAVAWLTAARMMPGRPRWGAALTCALLLFLTWRGLVLSEQNIDVKGYIEMRGDSKFKEVYKKWNEFARVAIVEITGGSGGVKTHQIVQDDGISNVYLIKQGTLRRPFRPESVIEGAPQVIGLDPRDVLVLFAGCGKDMQILNNLPGRTRQITGVEINPLLPQICGEHEILKDYGYADFYRLPNIHMIAREGRSFLEQNHTKYDLIFAGNSGSPSSVFRLGLTRKYLETREAFRQYLKHLRQGGLVIFRHWLNTYKIETLKAVHAELGKGRFEDAIFWSNQLIYKPSGFTPQERLRLQTAYGGRKAINFYVGGGRSQKRLTDAALVERPLQPGAVMTDDRPFAYPMNVPLLLSLFRKPQGAITQGYLARIVPILLVAFLSLILYFLMRSGPKFAIPGFHKLYFFVTGLCYMCVQTAMVAKFDVYLGNPLYSMAAIISVFILSNGIGSLLMQRNAFQIRLRLLFLSAVCFLMGTVYAAAAVMPLTADWPLFGKIFVSLLLLFPIAFVLGMFFPHGVLIFTKEVPNLSVPAAYGFSALGSVLGASYALLSTLNLGYNSILLQAGLGYCALLVVVWIRTARRGLPSGVAPG